MAGILLGDAENNTLNYSPPWQKASFTDCLQKNSSAVLCFLCKFALGFIDCAARVPWFKIRYLFLFCYFSKIKALLNPSSLLSRTTSYIPEPWANLICEDPGTFGYRAFRSYYHPPVMITIGIFPLERRSLRFFPFVTECPYFSPGFILT